jgi:phage terminase large subunit-like protein
VSAGVFQDQKTRDPADEYLALVAEKQRRDKIRRFELYTPYPKQAVWLNWNVPIKAIFGGNRIGKTYTAAYEMVCHLTGVYPVWWTGKRFFTAIEAWTVAVTAESSRDIIQKELFGDVRTAPKTGMIPSDLIVDWSMRQGVSDTIDQIWVRHVPTGGISVVSLKSNEQGREKMQGTAKHVVWIDEECDHDVFTECRLRTMTVQGIMIVTFTPLKGLTSLAKFLLKEPDATVVRRIIIGWDDVPHLSEEDKRQMSVGLLPHEIEARRTGLPTMATGLIYPFLAKDILVRPFDLEYHWPGIVGLDVAYTAPTAGAFLRYDRASRTTYLVDEHYLERQPTVVHVAAIRRRGCYPIRIDPAANRSERDGESIIKEYREEFGDGWEVKNANNAVYFGISRLYNAMAEGRFKVFTTCKHWIEEWSNYVWDDKKVNSDGHAVPRKKDDHVQDATRYAYVDIEDAQIVNGGMHHRHPLQTWSPLDEFTGF